MNLYRLASPTDVEDMDNVDGGISPEQLAVRVTQRRILLEKEFQVIDLLTTTGNYETAAKNDLSGGGKAQWDETTSTGINSPVRVVMNAQTVLLNQGGEPATDMWMGYDVFFTLLTHIEIRDRVSSDKDKTLDAIQKLLASFFGIKRMHTIWGVQNTANAASADSFAAMVSDKAGLYVRADNPSTVDFQFAVQFQKIGFPNGDTWVSQERMNTQMVETRDWFVHKVVSTLGGFLFLDVLT